jgi:two-component system C4-dicarboxylate transport sensor histidine kinase DctB
MRHRNTWLTLAALAVCAAASWLAFAVSLESNLAQLRRAAGERLDYYRLALDSTLEKYETLPYVLAQQSEVTRILAAPDMQAAAVNAHLERMAGKARLSAIYVMDPNGNTLVSSNWRQPGSFVGKNYGFRPYFTQAMAGVTGRFFAIGATTGEPGYFISHPVRGTRVGPDGGVDHDAVVGVVVVKLLLDELETAWEKAGDKLAVADESGVIFLSSVAAWRYTTLAPLPAAVRARLMQTRQYGAQSLPLLDGGVRDLMQQRREVGRLGWNLVLFTPTAAARSAAANTAVAAGFATAFVVALGLFLNTRKHRLLERAAARRALERADAELEARIAERTAALEARVADLKRTEELLRGTQGEVMQAGKLAVLGQMAAGMTHELNQPLTALRTLSDNATTLLALDQAREAGENLRMISELCERMGAIIQQLKSFSRKSGPRLVQVRVSDPVRQALRLVDADCRRLGVRVQMVEVTPGTLVLADSVRLEQVLVNLLRNAIDALASQEDRRLDLEIREADEGGSPGVRVSVRDFGPGIAPEAIDHLFEPFFTTKGPGSGLGLGLAISASIAEALGGRLRGANAEGGGAVFTLWLPRVAAERTEHAA